MPGTKRQKEAATLKRVFTGFAKTDRNNELIKETFELYENDCPIDYGREPHQELNRY